MIRYGPDAGSLELSDVTSGETVRFAPRRLVIAGYTGRDRSEVQQHIDELAALGVPAPDSIPAYYELSPRLLDWSSQIVVTSSESSGEAEPVLFCTSDGWYVGIGSDHTARDLERESIAASKACCAKPVSRQVLPFDDIAGVWDHLVLRSYADGQPYQRGSLAQMLPIPALVESYRSATGTDTNGLVLFCGTVPVLSGAFRYSQNFAAELVDGGEPLLTCTYRVITGV